jgi:glycerol uptake facilitator-like aquaporin
MAFPGALLELISEARLNPARPPVALISVGVILSAAALGLIIFKAPGGIFGAIVIFGLAEASLGFWVPRDDVDGWHATGKTVLWVSLLPLVLVFALGGLAFLK